MSKLKSSWELIEELNNANVTKELRQQIDQFIDKHRDKCTGKARSFSNLYFRSNMHYILDNIDSPQLLNQLTQFNQAS